MTNLILIVLNALGCVAIMIAALRYLEEHRTSPLLVRLVILVLSLVALMAAIETLGSRTSMRPWAVFLTVVTGAVALWKAFLPADACIFAWIAAWRPRSPPNGRAGLQDGRSG